MKTFGWAGSGLRLALPVLVLAAPAPRWPGTAAAAALPQATSRPHRVLHRAHGSANPPASAGVLAGDGQQAAPGTKVAVQPKILVRDTSNQPLQRIAVGFAVASGGGSVSAATALTGADGIATGVDWTLGPTEGRNTLQVTVGSLKPMLLVATAVFGDGSVPSGTVPTTGGTYAVTQPGPLHGFSLTVPSGAYAGATTWNLSYGSAAGLPQDRGWTVASPLIHLTSTAVGMARKPLVLKIPARVAEDQFPVVVMRDPVSGAMETCMTLNSDGSFVTAGTAQLDAAGLRTATAAGSPALAAGALRVTQGRGSYDIQIFVAIFTSEQLDADVDTGFRPGMDDWDFANPSTTLDPMGICSGQVVTAVWYYANRKAADGPLNGRFQEARGYPDSSRSGIRWANKVQADQNLQQWFDAVTSSWGGSEFATYMFGRRRYYAIKAALLVSRQPQIILAQNNVLRFGHALAVYRSRGFDLYVMDPNLPGNLLRTITFDPTPAIPDFKPYTMNDTYAGSELVQCDWIGGGFLSAYVDLQAVADLWPSVLDGTVASQDFPAYELRSPYGPLKDPIYIPFQDGEKLLVWAQCPTCPSYTGSDDVVPEATAPPLGWVLYRKDGPRAYTEFTNVAGVAYNKAGNIFGQAYAYKTSGDHAYAAVIKRPIDYSDPANPSAHYRMLWMDWKPFILRYLKGSITPASATIAPGSPVSLTFQVTPDTLPGHVIYSWDFGDGGPAVEVRDSPSVQHTYAAPGTYAIDAEALDPDTRQPLALATASASTPVPYWRVESVTEKAHLTLGTTLWPEEAASWAKYGPPLQRLLAVPNSGMLFVEPTATGTQLVLRIKPNGTWDASACCPPIPDGSEFVWILGSQPPVTPAFGSAFNDWHYQVFWSHTTDDLGQGTMSSWNYGSTVIFDGFPEGDNQPGPLDEWGVSFTRSGTQLTGDLSYGLSLRDSSRGLDAWLVETLSLTATRLR